MALWLLRVAIPGAPAGQRDWQALGSLPLQHNGRVKPLGSEAVRTLRLLSGRANVRIAGDGKHRRVTALEWYATLMFAPDQVAAYRVFRIDEPTLKDDLDLSADEKLFSYVELTPHRERVLAQAMKGRHKEIKELSRYERAVRQLNSKLNAYDSVARMLHPFAGLDYGLCLSSYTTLVPRVMALSRNRDDWSDDERQAFEMLSRLHGMLREVAGNDMIAIYPSDAEPPLAERTWLNPYELLLGGMQQDAQTPPAAAIALGDLQQAWRAGDLAAFNQLTADWPGLFSGEAGASEVLRRASFEQWFNAFDPFYRCIAIYVLVFLLACFACLGYTRELNRVAFTLMTIAFVAHTAGIVSRMLISGRPPVTNLYDSTLFVGWFCVLMAVIFERLFRNGFATLAASAIGTLTLLKGFQIAADGADTMGMLVAVLDSNFWLATHVICITIGYATCFFAAFIAHVFLIRGILTKSLTRPAAKQLDAMVYGVICFGLLFSIVGTILGGIWADQSWGRFWGWDPKENGALLICLWLIIILHGRMGGYLGQRGTMLCAVAGSVITAISWFGVNLLGAGLHSYGFTERGLQSFVLFIVAELIVIGVGLLPMKLWRSDIAPLPRDGVPASATTIDQSALPDPA